MFANVMGGYIYYGGGQRSPAPLGFLAF